MEIKISNQPIGQFLRTVFTNKWFLISVYVTLPFIIAYAALAPFAYISPFWVNAYLSIGVGLLCLSLISLMFNEHEAGLPLAFTFIYYAAIAFIMLIVHTEVRVTENNWVEYNGSLYASDVHDGAVFNIEEGSYRTITGMKARAVYDITSDGNVSMRHTESVQGIKVSVGYEWNSEFVKQNLDLHFIKLTDDILFNIIKTNPEAYNHASLSLDVCKATQNLGYKLCPLCSYSIYCSLIAIE